VLQAEVLDAVGKPLITSLLAGVPVHVVAARLGHADPSITLRVYAHVINDQLTGVGDIFAQAVKGSR
jgi:integrase